MKNTTKKLISATIEIKQCSLLSALHMYVFIQTICHPNYCFPNIKRCHEFCIKSYIKSYQYVSHLLSISHNVYALVVAQAYEWTTSVVDR